MYEIRILSNEEFDRLPYKHAKDALGMADAKRNVAYIRETGVKDLDQNTIEHEFDELLQKVSPHEEDGIRYKKMGGFFQAVVPILLSFVNPALGAAAFGLSAGKNFSEGNTLGGILSLAGGAGSLLAPTQLAAPVAGATKAGVNAGFTGSTANALSLGAGGARAGAQAGFQASTSGLQAASAAARAAGLAGFNTAQPASTLSKVGGTLAKQGLTDGLKQGLTPGGTSITGAGTELSAAGGGSGSTLDIFGGPEFKRGASNIAPTLDQGFVDSGFARIDQNAAGQTSNVLDQFRGKSIEGTSAFQRELANVGSSSQASKDSFLSEANANNNLSAERQSIMDANGLTEEQFNHYLDIARGDDNSIRSAVSNDPADFRAIFKSFL